MLKVFFLGYTADMQDIQPYYSLNGQDYYPQGEPLSGLDDGLLPGDVPSGVMAHEVESPLRDYLAREIDTFYTRVHYQSPAGSFVSQMVQITRPTEAQPLPEEMSVSVRYPSSMRMGSGFSAWYAYNMTAQIGATPEEISGLLPAALPIEVQLMDANNDFIARAFVACEVTWRLPEAIPPEGVVVADGVEALTPPGDFVLETVDAAPGASARSGNWGEQGKYFAD